MSKPGFDFFLFIHSASDMKRSRPAMSLCSVVQNTWIPSPSLQEKFKWKKYPWIPDKFLASWGEAHKEGVVHYRKCIKLSSTALDKFKEWLLVNFYWKFLYLSRTAPWGHFQKSCQKYHTWKQACDSNILQVINGAISLRREYFPLALAIACGLIWIFVAMLGCLKVIGSSLFKWRIQSN